MRPLRIALGDLSYINSENESNPNIGWQNNLYVPLNVGYLASYAKRKFGRDIEIALFKEPFAMLQHMRDERPDLIGLSAYYWNAELDKLMVRKARAISNYSPIIIMGGPSVDSEQEEQSLYKARNPGVDYVIPNEGEEGFLSVVASMLGGGEVNISLGLKTNLDELPSPYLDGTLDDFMDGPFQPMIQTSRLCPYTCLAGDTPINTIFGEIPIRELAEKYGDDGVPVYTYDPETKDAFISDSIRIRKYGQDKQLVRVHFDDGTYIDCTPDHKFLQFERGNKQWECEASKLPSRARVRAMRVEINEPLQRAYITWARRDRRLRSRIVKEYEIGRKLTRSEHVHHLDHNKLNDEPSNLELCASAADHASRHPEIAERMRINNPTKNGMSQEWKDRVGDANRGKVRSHESRLRYRESKLGTKNPNFKDGASAGRSRIDEVNHRVERVEWLAEKGDVYCLTVPATGWFFANNVLVKNCSFCVSGKSRGKLRAFPLDQVREELEYIGKRFNGRPDHVLHIVDENFGIMERDIEVAKFVHDTRAAFGYPQKVFFYNDKRFTQIARDVHEAVSGMVYHGVCLSLQSENPETLKAIKRRNLTDEQVTSAIGWAHGRSVKTSTELIFGLPMETRASFRALLDKCARLGFDSILCYNLIIFDGIEMNRKAYREQHRLRTMRRLMHGNSGMIDGELCVESEEVVIESSTFGFDDYKYFRAMNTIFHAIFINGLCRDFFRRLINSGASLTGFLERLLVPSGEPGHDAWLAELEAAMERELYDDDRLELTISYASAGQIELPSEIKIQPIFARKLSDNEHGWVAEVISKLETTSDVQMVA